MHLKGPPTKRKEHLNIANQMHNNSIIICFIWDKIKCIPVESFTDSTHRCSTNKHLHRWQNNRMHLQNWSQCTVGSWPLHPTLFTFSVFLNLTFSHYEWEIASDDTVHAGNWRNNSNWFTNLFRLFCQLVCQQVSEVNGLKSDSVVNGSSLMPQKKETARLE